MDKNVIRDAVQRFRFDRFKAEEEEWEYYMQRFETELALHRLLAGKNTVDTQRNLLLSKVGPEAFRPENVTTKMYVQLKDALKKHFQ